MITILLFRCIFTLSTSPSNTLRDLIVTVALYFDIHTDSAEHEVERILEYIRNFFNVTVEIGLLLWLTDDAVS